MADPFGAPAEVMYRTGDLVRWTADGDLEYLGRTDDQIKLRGFRIEPREIEARLTARPDVASALVLARSGPNGGMRRLVAYVVPAPGAAFDDRLLRAHVAAALPEHLVPSAVVRLDAVPLTPNGKVDRAALPHPEGPDRPVVAGRAHRGRNCSASFRRGAGPRSGGRRGQLLRAGWRLARRRHAGGTGDRTLRNPGRRTRSVRSVDCGRSGRPARWSGRKREPLATLLPLREHGSRTPLLRAPFGGVGWAYAGLLRHLDGDQPVYAVQARGLAESEDGRFEQLPASLDDMARDYVDQIRAVQPSGPYRLAGWSLGGLIAHRMASLLQELGSRSTCWPCWTRTRSGPPARPPR
ncbi:thioesterase domain-containing protein [Micromonospora sp. M12]